MKQFYLGSLFLWRMLSRSQPQRSCLKDVTLDAFPENTTLRVLSPLKKSIGDIVLLHGMSIKGYNDLRIMKLAEAIASLGFTVWLPQLDEITNHEIRHDVKERVNHLLIILKKHIAGPLAIMAPSYLGTIALTLAAEPRQYIKIHSLCCIGIFCDFNNFMNQVIQGQNVDPYGKAVFLKNLLLQEKRFTPGIHKILEAIFLNLQNQRDFLTDVDLNQLTSTEQAAIAPFTQTGLWHTIAPQLQAQTPPLLAVPKKMPDMQTKLAFIHGEKDTLASAAEIMPLISHLPPQQWQVSINALMEHGHHKYKVYQLLALGRLIKTFGFFFKHAVYR